MEDVPVIEAEPHENAPVEGINIHNNDKEDGVNKNHLSLSDDDDADDDEEEGDKPAAEVVIVDDNGDASINAAVVIGTGTTDATGTEAQKKREKAKRLLNQVKFARKCTLAMVAFTLDNKDIISIGGSHSVDGIHICFQPSAVPSISLFQIMQKPKKIVLIILSSTRKMVPFVNN